MSTATAGPAMNACLPERPIEDIVVTSELSSRPRRQPRYKEESEALQELSQHLTGDDPKAALQLLVDLALRLCRAGTAGVSLLEPQADGTELFRWVVLSGAFASYVGGTTPRNFSPCGYVLDTNQPQLYRRPGARFTYLNGAEPAIAEGLVVPFYVDGRAEGTIWIVSHDEAQGFDAEDVRLLTVLANFTAVAVRLSRVRLNEQRFREMADTAPAILRVAAVSGSCTFVSRSWYELTGQAAGEALGFGWLDAVHTDDRATARERFLDGTRKQEMFAVDYRLRDVRGDHRWVIDVTRPWFDPDGRYLGSVAAVVDITERKEAELRAVEANRAKDEFLAMLGHELRNPLSPIVTAVQLMRLRGNDARELSLIDRQVSHLCRLVDDLLDISRITRGKIELHKQRQEIAGAVVRGIEMAAPLLDQRRQKLDLQLPPEGLLVEGDPQRLPQIVSNLVNNAAKYSDPGTTIRISASRAGDRVRLSIADQGVGIEAEMLDRIFDTFVQQSQTLDRSKGGLGLGLSIVRSLVQLHGGTVTARSEGANRGSEFIVELPLAAGADEPATRSPLELRSAVSSSVTTATRSRRILVVDDNEDAATSIAALLTEMGHAVQAAHDGPTALRMAPAFRPEICLLDIGLPVMDGYELARHIRTLDGLPDDLRVIALTGYGRDADRRRTDAAGFDAHVVKPVTFDVLRGLVLG